MAQNLCFDLKKQKKVCIVEKVEKRIRDKIRIAIAEMGQCAVWMGSWYPKNIAFALILKGQNLS